MTCCMTDVFKLKPQYVMGRRTFERRFKAATGDTPNLYIQRDRVGKANLRKLILPLVMKIAVFSEDFYPPYGTKSKDVP